MSQPYSKVASLLQTLFTTGARKAIKYVSPKQTIKVTRQHPRSGRGDTVLVTIGRPNYAERQFIKSAVRAGEPFPVRKPQLKFKRVA